MKYWLLAITLVVLSINLFGTPVAAAGDGWSAIFLGAILLLVVTPLSLAGFIIALAALAKQKRQAGKPQNLGLLWTFMVSHALNVTWLFSIGWLLPEDIQDLFFLIPLAYFVTALVQLIVLIANWHRLQ